MLDKFVCWKRSNFAKKTGPVDRSDIGGPYPCACWPWVGHDPPWAAHFSHILPPYTADHHLFSNIQYQFGHQDSQQIFTFFLLLIKVLAISLYLMMIEIPLQVLMTEIFLKLKYLIVQALCPAPPLGLYSTTQEMAPVRVAPPYLAQMCQTQRSGTLPPCHRSAPSGGAARASRTRGRLLRARCQSLNHGILVKSPLCLPASLSSRRPALVVTLASAVGSPHQGASPTPHLIRLWSLTRWLHLLWFSKLMIIPQEPYAIDTDRHRSRVVISPQAATEPEYTLEKKGHTSVIRVSYPGPGRFSFCYHEAFVLMCSSQMSPPPLPHRQGQELLMVL